MTQTVQKKSSAFRSVLYMALELSKSTWLLAFSDGDKIRRKGIRARNLDRVVEEVASAKRRFGLAEDVEMVSCYEAGLDGFWIHRWLLSKGVRNHVIDAGSIEGSSRRRKPKTDKIDAEKLVRDLIRHDRGEKRVWSVVRVPSLEQEDERRPHRELESLRRERTRLVNRMWGLLMSQGLCDVKFGRNFEDSFSRLELWDGGPLPTHLEREILRIRERIELVERQIGEIRKARARWLEQPSTEADRCAEKLFRIKAVGENSAWLFSTEFFAWREFKNGKQVGALGGLTGTPHASGSMNREKGISKAGNARVRRMAVELAWSWQRWQPQSALTKWFKERFGSGGPRMRRIGIVALARKILVVLWRYLEFGEVPEGAVMKAV